MKRLNLRVLTSLLAGIILVACTPKKEQQPIVFTHYELEEIVPLMEGVKDSMRLMVSVDYPTQIESVNETALHNIRTSLVKHSFGENYCSYGLMDTIIEHFRQDVISEYRRDNLPLYEQVDEEEFAINLNNEHLLTVSPMGVMGHIVSYAVERYLFLGGAHGINNRIFLNFDKQTGHLLTEDDIFVSEASDALTHLLLLNLVRQNDDLSLISDVEASDYEKESIRPNGNFYFAPEGVVFVFNPYEIGPYYLGETSICIPRDEIKPYLKTDWNIYVE